MYVIETSLKLGILALTPLQRFHAVKNFDAYNNNRDFTRFCLFAVVVLLVVLLMVSFRRINREKKTNVDLFTEYANQRGLTEKELAVLHKIIRKAGLNQAASIFTMATAFEKGCDKIKKELFKKQNREELDRIEPLFSSLRFKLGFQKDVSFSRGIPGSTEKVSSRQIPIGKKVTVERKNKNETETIEAAVIRNIESELAIQLDHPTTIIFGESWKVQYFFGSSIWEFETFVTSYDGNIMVLSHSDDVHFVNRRRFMRAPVRKEAFIAHFPFQKTLNRTFEQKANSTSETNFPEIPLKPLYFLPAKVIEMGGPGLKIETSMQVKTGDRILVMFELERSTEHKTVKNPQTDEISNIYTSTLTLAENVGVVEEAGIVRRQEDNSEHYTIGVELMGLRDADIDTLIRATNNASLAKNENAPENTPAEINA
ncbi:MAG: hypothetical protein ABFD79_11915 [Phycisphaerales bacterium]